MENMINIPFSFLRSGLFINLLLHPIITQLTINTQTLSAMDMFENVSLSTVEMIENSGYSVEIHDVITQDGYILELHRIPNSKSGQKPTRNYPVFIHHGILGSSADWILGGANISLPIQLADAGYDVWLANCRGNTYSRKHVSMTSKQKAYWNFSLHEVGKYDLPASIDYILKNTKSPQLHYIGYSMGSCVFFIMGSERPEYQPKIRSQISLAPVAYLSNTRSSLRYIAPYAKVLNIMYQRIAKGMLLPQSKFQTFLATTVCKERMMQKLICERCFIFSVCGSDPQHFNSKLIPLIMGHFPAGTSSKLAAHFAQFILKDTFGQYDYGSRLNMQYYNSTEPPTYDLKSIQVPITLIHGENDILADKEDVMRLKDQLPKLIDVFSPGDPYFNHVDFLWSLKVNEMINVPVRHILAETDNPEWRYTGPRFIETNEIDGGHGWIQASVKQPVTAMPGSPKGLEFLVENLDAVIASTMPRVVDDRDAEDFERERKLQNMLFGEVIRLVKSTKENMAEWTDGVATGVLGARDAVDAHVKKTTVLVGDGITYAGWSVASGVSKAESAMSSGVSKAENAVSSGVAKAENVVSSGVAKVENVVSSGVAKAENFVVVGVARAENFVAGGVARAENFVAGGVAKAEQSVVGSIVTAENFVNNGVNKADRAVGNAMNVTFRTLSRAFWFLK